MSVLTVLSVLAFAQVVPTPAPVGPQSFAAWDHSGLDEQGGPETLAGFELVMIVPGGDPNSPTAAMTVPATPTTPGGNDYEVVLTNLLQGLPAGPQDLYVRAIDAAGNQSAWSNVLVVTIDQTRPAVPTNISVSIRITFTN